LSLPDFALYQTFADGHSATYHITSFVPEELRSMQKSVTKPAAEHVANPVDIES
jgi:hypothetical protein